MQARIGALLLAAALSALPARAQDDVPGRVIGPAAFEALTTGRTLTFALGGAYYGAEQYLAERKVIWRLGDGGCIGGEWYGRGEDICFVYDAVAGVQCWRFTRRGGRIHASSLSGDLDLEAVGSTERPLACPGPDMGV